MKEGLESIVLLCGSYFCLVFQYCRSQRLSFGSSLSSGMKEAELCSHFLNERGREECWHVMCFMAVQ